MRGGCWERRVLIGFQPLQVLLGILLPVWRTARCDGGGVSKLWLAVTARQAVGRSVDGKAPESISTSGIEPRYRGVGGWLAFFIVSLVVIRPIAHLVHFLRNNEHTLSVIYKSQHPYSLLAWYLGEKIVLFAIVGYGVFAGIQLFRIRPGAVWHAKTSLFYLLMYALADYIIAMNWVGLMVSNKSHAAALSNFLAGPAARSAGSGPCRAACTARARAARARARRAGRRPWRRGIA